MQTTRLTLLLAAALLAAPALADPSEIVPDMEELKEDTSRETVERDMKPSDKEDLGCGTLVRETRAACRDMVERNLKVDCYRFITAIEVSQRQAEGDLFDSNGNDKKVSEMACRVNVRSLRRKIEKAKGEMLPADAVGPSCKALGEKLDGECLSKLGTKDWPKHCKLQFMSYKTRPGKTPEEKCATLLPRK